MSNPTMILFDSGIIVVLVCGLVCGVLNSIHCICDCVCFIVHCFFQRSDSRMKFRFLNTCSNLPMEGLFHRKDAGFRTFYRDLQRCLKQCYDFPREETTKSALTYRHSTVQIACSTAVGFEYTWQVQLILRLFY